MSKTPISKTQTVIDVLKQVVGDAYANAVIELDALRVLGPGTTAMIMVNEAMAARVGPMMDEDNAAALVQEAELQRLRETLHYIYGLCTSGVPAGPGTLAGSILTLIDGPDARLLLAAEEQRLTTEPVPFPVDESAGTPPSLTGSAEEGVVTAAPSPVLCGSCGTPIDHEHPGEDGVHNCCER